MYALYGCSVVVEFSSCRATLAPALGKLLHPPEGTRAILKQQRHSTLHCTQITPGLLLCDALRDLTCASKRIASRQNRQKGTSLPKIEVIDFMNSDRHPKHVYLRGNVPLLYWPIMFKLYHNDTTSRPEKWRRPLAHVAEHAMSMLQVGLLWIST